MIPPLGISILPVSVTVTEGEPVQFQITNSTPSNSELDVQVFVSNTGDFFTNSDGISTVVIDALRGSAILEIPTIDNAIYQLDGEIIAEIRTDTSYKVSQTANQASVIVLDNDLPLVSISGSNDIEEGGSIEFQIEASTAPLGDISVEFDVSQTGDFLDELPTNRGVLSSNQTSVTIQIPTINDSIDELDGEIVVVLQSGLGYILAESPQESLQNDCK